MCLAVIDWQPGHPTSLRAVANRDEFRGRPTAALAEWPDLGIVGGRDLEAGGSWLAFDRRGRFALLTNLRSATSRKAERSRGELVARFLCGSQGAGAFLREIVPERFSYGPFNLLLGERDALTLLSSADGEVRALGPGIHCLSNGRPGDEWPKCRLAREQMRREGANLEVDLTAHTILRSTAVFSYGAIPATGLPAEVEQRLSAQTIVGGSYGTRSRTHFLCDRAGRFRIAEEQLDAAGDVASVVRLVVDGRGVSGL